MQGAPVGVGIIASIHALSSLFLLIHVIISIPFIIVLFFEDFGLGALAAFETIWDWILIGIHAAVAGALFTGKKWAGNFVLIMAGIGLIFGVINVLSGNTFAIVSIIISAVVISYIRKPHVKAWLSKDILE